MAEFDGDGGEFDYGDSSALEGAAGISSDEEYETMTPAEVLEKLEEAWMNEKFSPELLEHKTHIVDCILEQIKEMEETLSHIKKGDFVASIHKLELDRVRFVLSSYLRNRIQKIEKHVVHVLEQEASRSQSSPSRLSSEELAYAKEYADNMDSHLNSLVLRHMPANFKKVDRKKAVRRPNLDSYVFIRAVRQTDQVAIDTEEDGADQEVIDLLPGNQYILPYRPISTLVHSGAAKLI